MTKKNPKNISWKLKDLPTTLEVKQLFEAGILSKDEAREILLGNAESDKEKIEALEKHVEFLEELVKDLAKQRNSITYVPFHRTIDYSPRPYYEKVWMNTVNNLKASGINLDRQDSTLSWTNNNSVTGKYESGAKGQVFLTANLIDGVSGATGGTLVS